MQRNRNNKVELIEVATGKRIEVASPTAQEIMRHQHKLLAEGKKADYVLPEVQTEADFDKRVENIARRVFLAMNGSARLDAHGHANTAVAPPVSNMGGDEPHADDEPPAETVTKEEAVAAAKAILEDGNLKELTAKGKPTKAAIEARLGRKVSQKVFLSAISS